MDELFTLKEACTHLRISRSTLYRFLYSGKLKGYKVGWTWRFAKQDLQKVLKVA